MMDYTTFLVVDAKTALWERAVDCPPGQTEEIIALDLALIDTNKLVFLDQDTILVKPAAAKISEYCYKATGIAQSDVDRGIPFKEAYRKLRIDYMSRDRAWGSWGIYEKYAIDRQCKLMNIESPFKQPNDNIQRLYSQMIGLNTETNYISLSQAMQFSDEIPSRNRAVNVANLFMRMAKGLRPARSKRVVYSPYFNHN